VLALDGSDGDAVMPAELCNAPIIFKHINITGLGTGEERLNFSFFRSARVEEPPIEKFLLEIINNEEK